MSETYPDPSQTPNYPPPPAPVEPSANPDNPAPQAPYGQPQYPQPQYPQPQYGQPQYGQPQYPQPQYGQPQYPQPQYGQPQYGQPPGGYYPSAPAFNAYGYPPAPGGRLGQVLASSVLAYVLAGILILTGMLLLFGASTVSTFGDSFNRDTSGATAELAFDGFVDLGAAGLLIAGGVSLTGGHRRGRTLLVVATGVTLLDCLYWLARTSAHSGVLVFLLVYGGLAAAALVAALSGQVSAWLNARQAAAGPAYRA